jgi:hypothetical protein
MEHQETKVHPAIKEHLGIRDLPEIKAPQATKVLREMMATLAQQVRQVTKVLLEIREILATKVIQVLTEIQVRMATRALTVILEPMELRLQHVERRGLTRLHLLELSRQRLTPTISSPLPPLPLI